MLSISAKKNQTKKQLNYKHCVEESDISQANILVAHLVCCQLWSINIWIRKDVCLGRYRGEYICLRRLLEEVEPYFTL